MGAALPAMAESPFALSGYYPSRSRLQAAWAGVTRPSSLLRTHAPDRDAPWAFALARSLGLRRLLRAPAANRPFPTLSLQSLSRRLDPYPAVMSRCFSSFLPKTQRPHITRDTFGSPDNPCMATSAGGLISGLQSFAHVQAPRLARPPGCSRRFIAEERLGRLHHASLGWLPAPRCGIATCVNEQFTRLDFHQLDCSLVGCSPLPLPLPLPPPLLQFLPPTSRPNAERVGSTLRCQLPDSDQGIESGKAKAKGSSRQGCNPAGESPAV